MKTFPFSSHLLFRLPLKQQTLEAKHSRFSNLFSRSYSSPAPTPSPSASGSGFPRQLVIASLLAAGGAGAYFYSSSSSSSSASGSPASMSSPPLDPESFKGFKLNQIIPVSDNTSIFRFQLAPGQALNLPVASFLLTQFKDEKGQDVVRPYTPISKETDKGFFDLLVKQYPGGPMSTYIHSLKPGEVLNMKGPIVKYEYTPNMHKSVGMVAGGTGITPMLQVIYKILDNPEDKTKVSLIFGNLTEKDILLKEQLDGLASKHPERFQVTYTVDKPPSGWKGEKGYVTQAMAAKYLPSPKDENIKIFTCGPPPMVKAIAGSKAPDFSQGELDGLFKQMGYTKEQVFKF